MAEAYLGGKVTVSSLSAPTVADRETLRALSEDDRRLLVAEALARGRQSPLSERSIDDIWSAALDRACAIGAKRQNVI